MHSPIVIPLIRYHELPCLSDGQDAPLMAWRYMAVFENMIERHWYDTHSRPSLRLVNNPRPTRAPSLISAPGHDMGAAVT